MSSNPTISEFLQRIKMMGGDPIYRPLVIKLQERLQDIPEGVVPDRETALRIISSLTQQCGEEFLIEKLAERDEAEKAQHQEEIQSAHVVVGHSGYQEPCNFDQAIAMHTECATLLRKQLVILDNRLDELREARESGLYKCIHDFEEYIAAQRLITNHNARAQYLAEQRRRATKETASTQAQTNDSTPSHESQPPQNVSSSPIPVTTPVAGTNTGVASKASTTLPLFQGNPAGYTSNIVLPQLSPDF